jgi:hypothetical protein
MARARGRVDKSGQCQPLLARDDTFPQSGEHDESIRRVESQKDGTLIIQQAGAVKV